MVLLRTVVIARDRHTRALGFSGKEKRKKKREKGREEKKKLQPYTSWSWVYRIRRTLVRTASFVDGKLILWHRNPAVSIKRKGKKMGGVREKKSISSLFLLSLPQGPIQKDKARVCLCRLPAGQYCVRCCIHFDRLRSVITWQEKINEIFAKLLSIQSIK